MNPIHPTNPAETSKRDLNAYFEALQLTRATPIVRMFLALGITIAIVSIFHDLILIKKYIDSVIVVRVIMASILGALLYFFWTPIKALRLSLNTVVLMSFVCVSVSFTVIYAVLSEMHYIITVKLSLCLFALVIIQMGVRIVVYGSAIITLVPTALFFFTDTKSTTIFSIFLFHTMWSGCAILAAHLLQEHNKRMFFFERQLYEINRMAVKAQEDESKASQEKSRFVANMSHEIRTPLTAIMGYSESLINDHNSYKEIKNALSVIHRNSQHLLSITNDVLDLSKVEAGKLQINPEPSSLFSVIDEIESLLQKQAEDNHVELIIKYNYPLPLDVLFDPLRLRQVLFNICSNAIKFSKGGKVQLEVSANDNMKILIFRTIDNGIGMDQQTVRNLFRPFAQGDISTTRRYGGTGLGLYIAFQLAKRMEGDIKVISEPGSGSEFSLILPLKESLDTIWVEDKPVQVKSQSSYEQTVNSLSGTVLLAEDQQDNQHLITTLLTRLGLKVTAVENGELALQKALSEHYDVILMDMQMPVMDGFEATQLMIQSGVKSPIIALSANVMKQDIEKYIKIGCKESLSKPIDRKELYQCLKQYLKSPEEKTEEPIDFYNTDAIKKLSRDYLIRLEKDYNELNDAIEKIEWSALSKPAHRIKGAAGNFNYDGVSAAAADIEIAVKDCQRAVQYALKQIESDLLSEQENKQA
ncbi:sensor histidine kinase [Pleionea sediminis]|uniref:sensor histidine kinase n=1 Tax=Pleionea sediminis TaxID=2569479 RepID=UPI001186A2DD|nr:sensor histidine kinase [Pleionea sediminis]